MSARVHSVEFMEATRQIHQRGLDVLAGWELRWLPVAVRQPRDGCPGL